MGGLFDVIVLDTHIWYWWINLDFDRLSKEIIEAIENSPRVGVSAVSCFELALANKKGRLQLPLPLPVWFERALSGSDIELLALTPAIASGAASLSEVHRDPFDRMIIATTLEVDGLLVSVDGHFPAYSELSGRLLGSGSARVK